MDAVVQLMWRSVTWQRPDVSSRETHVRQIESDPIGIVPTQIHELLAPVIEETWRVWTPVVIVIDAVQVEEVLYKDS